MSTEYIKGQGFQDYMERAKNAPKIGPEEGADMDTGQFGNNFYLLFLARKRILVDPEKNANDTLVRIYLRRAEEYGDPWQKFIKENSDLLDKIDRILGGEQQEYSDISYFAIKLLTKEHYDEYDELDKAVGHPLGLDAIRIAVWRKFNPLLEMAASEMEKKGIPPEKFFG